MDDVVEPRVINGDSGKTKIIYYLYLAGLVFGITGLIGVVMAYLERGDEDTPDWIKSHCTWQIRTFWIGALFLFTGVLLALVIVGYFILLFWVVWLIVRTMKGMKMLDKKKPVENVSGWMF